MNTFGWALKQMNNGAKVRRRGWNGKGMWIAITPGSTIYAAECREGAALKLATERANAIGGGLVDVPGHIVIGAHIDMKAADGTLVIGWLASQTDMLETDWEVAF